MEQIHKDALRRTRVALVKDLDVNNICDELLSQDIFTQLMMEYIMAERTRIDKVRRLLDDLVRRGPDAYLKFLDVLKKTGYEFLANLIIQNEEILRREKEPFSSIPIQATNQTQGEIHPASRPRPMNITATQSSFVGSQNSNSNSSFMESFGSSSMVYSRSSGSSLPLSRSGPSCLNPQPAGLVVRELEFAAVESNEDDKLDLTGSSPLNPSSMDVDENDSHIGSVDEEALLREPLTYAVQPLEDGNRPYSLEPAPFTSRYSSHSIEKRYTMDSKPRGAVLIINNKNFENDHHERPGTEQDCMKLKNLFEDFDFFVSVKEDLKRHEILSECWAFARRPTLANVDCMVLAVLSHGTAESLICGVDGGEIHVFEEIIPIFSPKKCPSLRGKPKMYIFNACRGEKTGHSILNLSPSVEIERDELQRDGPYGDREYTSQVLDNQDILLCYSTFPGYTSYRDPEKGSWYIQEFVDVFREQAHDEHVMDMLIEINKRVSQRNHRDTSSTASCVQIPCPATSLTKKWYLNPPLLGATSLGH